MEFTLLNIKNLVVMKNILILTLSMLGLVFQSFAQITVTNTATPNQLVQNILLGFGVSASNIKINGATVNAGIIQTNMTYFNAGSNNFPIQSGVLLTTGKGIAAIGPNSSGSFTNGGTPNVSSDPHLNAIANGSVTNGIVLEFDFVPAGDTISFKYIFGSDEYPEFSPSSFNDAFGFFLWGPGISGPYTQAGYPNGGANIAVIPGTTIPVTINNVGPGATQNNAYYVNNLGGVAYGPAIQYDATTTLLTANASVQCGQTYHIKLAICNVGDQSYDSGVFLQANSFSSEAVQVVVAPSVASDTVVYESNIPGSICTNANFYFIRPEAIAQDSMVIAFDLQGTADFGVDFDLISSPGSITPSGDSVIFLPGQDTVIVTLNPIADLIPDNLESVIITVTTISQCGDTIVSTGTLYIIDTTAAVVNGVDKLVFCKNDSVRTSVSATGTFPPFSYIWNDANNQQGDTVFLSTIFSNLTGDTNYIVTAIDACGYPHQDTVTISLNQTLIIDTLIMGPATCDPTGYVSGVIQGQTGTPIYNWSGPGPNSPNFINASVWSDLGSGWYYFKVKDNVCEVRDSIFVTLDNPPSADFSANITTGCSPLEVTFTNNSQNTNNYTWNFGDGQWATSTDLSNQTHIFTASSVVQMIAYQTPTCADTMNLTILVANCGCTDPTATNYDPNATLDNGSCQYPTPEVEAPNIITPNGDLINDIFELKFKNIIEIELIIINRWGNVIYQTTSPNPTWDGKVNGNEVAEGVYFYRYLGKGFNDTNIEGEGFFHLERK